MIAFLFSGRYDIIHDVKNKQGRETAEGGHMIEIRNVTKTYSKNKKKAVDNLTLNVEGGKLFGSVTGKEIAQAFKDQCNVDIDKKKIQLAEPIKSFGVFDVPVKLHPQVTGSLKVKVKEQN